MWYVYILLLNNNNYYTGITNDLVKRLQTHSSGKGSKYVRSNKPFELIYIETAQDRSKASKREYAIKQLTRAQKDKLIKTNNNIINQLGGNKYYE